MTDLNWDTEDIPPADTTFESDEPLTGYDAIFGAPDYAAIVKTKRSALSRDYEVKVQSMLKALTLGAMKRGNLPDAAALLQSGPAFAEAAGNLAAENERAKRAIDILTAPDSPYFVFGLTAVTLLSQLMRNHQAEAELVAQNVKKSWKERRAAKRAGIRDQDATTTVRLPFGRKITLGFRLRIPVFGTILRGLTGTAVRPDILVASVFADEKLQTQLRKQGITLKVSND